jgi:hypothetical protein
MYTPRARQPLQTAREARISAMSTPNGNTVTTARIVHAIIITQLFACSPGDIAGEGSGDTGDATGEAGGAGRDHDGELPTPGVEVTCVEMVPSSITCWVDWMPGVDAQILLECQAAAGVSAGAWGAAYELEVPVWGLVMCHDVTGTDGAVCLFGDARVVLTETIDGWIPELSALVSQYSPAEPPCEG